MINFRSKFLSAAIAAICFFAALPARAAELKDLGKAPAISLQTLDGKAVTLESLKGKVVVVDFWATWCPPCVAEIPGFVELQKKYADRGLVFIGISLDQRGADHVREFVKKNKVSYLIAMGDDTHVDAFGGFNAIPTTFLIDRQGVIRHRKTGAMSHDEYEKLLKSVL